MDQTLQRLLDAEAKAEQMTRQADEAREQIIQSALLEAQAREQRFEAGVPALHASFIDQAEERARQLVNEHKRRYGERGLQLQRLAEQHAAEALDAAFSLLIAPKA